MSEFATKDWVRYYFEESFKIETQRLEDLYEKFLRQRDLILTDMNEQRKAHHETVRALYEENQNLRTHKLIELRKMREELNQVRQQLESLREELLELQDTEQKCRPN